MDSDSEAQNGFYQDRDLPVRLAERAARVSDDAEQLSIAAFRSSDALILCKDCRRNLVSERKKMVRFVVLKGNEAQAKRKGVPGVNHVLCF